MFTTLALTTALLAPAAPLPTSGVPAQGAAAPVAATTGAQAPKIINLKPDADGKVKITVMRPKALPNVIILNRPGAAPGAGGPPVMVPSPEKVELTDVKDLKITTAAGKEVSKEDAIKALAKGGQVVVSADGKSVASEFLKMFKDEVLVLVSPELVVGNGANGFFIQGGQGQVVPIGTGPRAVPNPAPPAPKQD